jgi:hypothetical protein
MDMFLFGLKLATTQQYPEPHSHAYSHGYQLKPLGSVDAIEAEIAEAVQEHDDAEEK